MIKVIHYQDETTERPLEAIIGEYYDGVRKLLPELPETIQVYFSDYGILAGSGVGAFAYAHDILTISIDPYFKNKNKQRNEIRAAIFHESFHLYQNFTSKDGPFSAIDNALYEGMATIFEREYCGIWQPYGDYRMVTEEKLKLWMNELRQLSLEDFRNNYREWKFFHPKYNARWIVYKVGTWMIDQILQDHTLTIFDLSFKTAAEILKLYDDKPV